MQPPGCREAVEQGRADATLLKSTACATVDQNVTEPTTGDHPTQGARQDVQQAQMTEK